MADPQVPDAPDRPRRRTATIAVVALIVVLAAAGTWLGSEVVGRAGLPAPATAEGRDVERVWRILLAMAGAVSGVVLALLLVALVDGWRNRHGPEPEQVAGSLSLELVYTALPLALVAAVFVISLAGTERLDADVPPDALHVQVTGFQWGWRFDYGGESGDGPVVVGAETDPPELVLPAGETIALELESHDVIHSFYSPAFLTKLDVIPGRTNVLVVEPERIGTYIGHCAEFCGLDHARMNFTVRIVGADEFDRWVSELRAKGEDAGG